MTMQYTMKNEKTAFVPAYLPTQEFIVNASLAHV